jgi:hypothetical protein
MVFAIEMGFTVGATGQQGMLTPPRHLIPPPVFPGVRVCPFVYLTCNFYLNFKTDYSSVSWPFYYGYIANTDGCRALNVSIVVCAEIVLNTYT